MRRVALCLCGLLAICLLTPVSSGAADPVKLGLLLPITGSNAPYGQNALRGFKLAQEARPTVLGRPVEYVVVDNKSDNIECSNATSRLIQKDQVTAIIGPLSSKNSLAAAPLCEEAKVPMVSPWATNPLVTQNRKYAFRVCFIDPFQGQVAARYAYHNLKARKAAILTDVSQDYAVALAAFFKREFQKLGGVVVAEVKCNTNDQDFSAQLGAIKGTDAEILYLPNYYTEDALVARQSRELGLNLPILSGDGANAPELLKIGGPAVEGLTFTAHFHRDAATSPAAAGFLALFDRKHQAGELKEELTGFHSLGADAYLVLLDAITRAGSSAGPKLRQALAGTQGFAGITGRLSIGPDGNAVKSVAMLRAKDGKFEFVTTIEP